MFWTREIKTRQESLHIKRSINKVVSEPRAIKKYFYKRLTNCPPTRSSCRKVCTARLLNAMQKEGKKIEFVVCGSLVKYKSIIVSKNFGTVCKNFEKVPDNNFLSSTEMSCEIPHRAWSEPIYGELWHSLLSPIISILVAVPLKFHWGDCERVQNEWGSMELDGWMYLFHLLVVEISQILL